MSEMGSASIPTPTILTHAWLRFAPRHIHATIVEYLEARLAELGWTTSTPPLGAPRANVTTYLPPESELHKVQAGMVAITLGDEPDADQEEMGGPLHSQEIPFYVDVFMDKDANATSLASDVKDCLRGRLPNTRRVLPVKDFSYAPAIEVPGWTLEFVDIERVRVDRLPVYWQSIHATALVDFPEEVY